MARNKVNESDRMKVAQEIPPSKRVHTAVHFTSPQYIDIMLLIRRYNMNFMDGDSQRIDYEMTKSAREKLRPYEERGYSKTHKNIDYLIKSLLYMRRASSMEELASMSVDYNRLGELFSSIMLTESANQVTGAVAAKLKDYVAHKSQKPKPKAGFARGNYPPFKSSPNVPTSSHHKAEAQPKQKQPAPPNHSHPHKASPSPNLEPISKAKLPHYTKPAPAERSKKSAHPQKKHSGRSDQSSLSAVTIHPYSIRGPPSTDAYGVRRSLKARIAEEAARGRGARLEKEVKDEHLDE